MPPDVLSLIRYRLAAKYTEPPTGDYVISILLNDTDEEIVLVNIQPHAEFISTLGAAGASRERLEELQPKAGRFLVNVEWSRGVEVMYWAPGEALDSKLN